MVGVLDKEKGIMELHKADIFHMTPYIKGILYLMQKLHHYILYKDSFDSNNNLASSHHSVFLLMPLHSY